MFHLHFLMKSLLIVSLAAWLAPASYAAHPVLLVDDDGGKSYEKKYQQWFHEAGLPYLLWDGHTNGPPPLKQMQSYSTIFWFTGDGGALSDEAEGRLKDYLDDRAGKRSLMLTGDDVANGLRHDFNDHHQFLGWYLNARYIKTEGDPVVGVNEQSDVFQWAFLPAIFRNYSSAGDYSFKLWNKTDIVKPNDWNHRTVMLPHKNTPEGSRNTLEAVAVSNRKHFKTVFVTFDLAHEDNYYINESEFIKTCIEWLQK